MAYIANTPEGLGTKLTRTIKTNATATTHLPGPKEVSGGGGGGPTIPTEGIIWWPKRSS